MQEAICIGNMVVAVRADGLAMKSGVDSLGHAARCPSSHAPSVLSFHPGHLNDPIITPNST